MDLKTRIKKLIPVIAIGITVIWVIWWFSSYSFLEISIVNKPAGEITFSLTDSANGKLVAQTSEDKSSFKKLVKRGHYQVRVTKDETSSLTTLKAKGFLRTSKAETELKAEQARTFIGDNPGYCTLYTADILVSNDCSGSYENTKTHLPATSSLPSYTLSDKDSLIATAEGFVVTPEGTFIMLLQPVSEDRTQMHILYRLEPHADKASTLSHVANLPSLNPSQNYSIQAYQTGFITYDTNFSHVLYFASINSEPTELKFGANEKSLSAQDITATKEGIVAIYSNINALNKQSIKKPKTEIVWLSNNSIKHSTHKKHYTSVMFCGLSKLCALTGNGMDVYNLKNDKLRLLYSLADVQAARRNGNGLGIITSYGLLSFDTEKGSGSYLYSFGDYKFNALGQSGDSFILNVSSPKSKRVALLISNGNNDRIDKKVLEIEKLPEVATISIYKSFIHITPNLGGPVYNPETGFGFDPNARASASNAINAAVQKNGIDTNVYTVVNAIP
jgi:hypothetical protein